MQHQGTPSRIPIRIKTEDGAPLAASLEIPRRQTSRVRSPSQTPVKVKVEDVEEDVDEDAEEDVVPVIVNTETPRRFPSFSEFQEAWSRSPLRVPTPLAREFYRCMIVKRESDELLGSEDGMPLLCHDCDRSAGIHTKKPPTEASCDLCSPSPRSVVKFKEEAELLSGRHIPAGAYKAETISPSASPRIQHQTHPATNQSRLYHEARFSGRNTATSPPTCRPDTEFSYLLPVTPTPFSTPNAPINPYNRPAHLHCIPGSLLEGMHRRTRWGRRDIWDKQDDKERRKRRAKHEKRAKQRKQAKQDKPVKQAARIPARIPQSPSARLAEYVAEDEHEISHETSHEEAESGHEQTCAWYKIPFCKCCACIMVVGTKLLRSIFIPSLVVVPRPCRTTSMIPKPKRWVRKRKWCHLQKSSKRRDGQEVIGDESHAARRHELFIPGRVVVVREI